MKRNDVVMENDHEGSFWSPYGRINRVIDDTHVEVIDCLRNITVYNVKDIQVVKYIGHYFPRSGGKYVWRSMPSLRQLKQMASRYHNVWKKLKPWQIKCNVEARQLP